MLRRRGPGSRVIFDETRIRRAGKIAPLVEKRRGENLEKRRLMRGATLRAVVGGSNAEPAEDSARDAALGLATPAAATAAVRSCVIRHQQNQSNQNHDQEGAHMRGCLVTPMLCREYDSFVTNCVTSLRRPFSGAVRHARNGTMARKRFRISP